MTTYMTRVMLCDMTGCTERIEAIGTLMDLRASAEADGWKWEPGHDLCPIHAGRDQHQHRGETL